MNTEKKVLDSMERCYAAGSLTLDGELYVLLASEAEGGACRAYGGQDFSRRETIWENAGGTMSLVELPNAKGEFLAVQNFFPGFRSDKAKIVYGRRDAPGKWTVRDLLALPFLHRFDIFEVGGVRYFLGATLCGSKKDREDWSDPGKIWVGALPESLDKNGDIELYPVLENLYRNHGYWRGIYEGRDAGWISCDAGVYVVLPPRVPGGTFEIRHVLKDRPISDIALVDIDEDGTDELVTIEPFHGDGFFISKLINGKYEKVWSYPNEIAFAHAVWGGRIRGRPAVIGGVRRKSCELFMVRCANAKNQEYEIEILETGVGPSNVAVVNQPEQDILISANHTKNEAAVYLIRD